MKIDLGQFVGAPVQGQESTKPEGNPAEACVSFQSVIEGIAPAQSSQSGAAENAVSSQPGDREAARPENESDEAAPCDLQTVALLDISAALNVDVRVAETHRPARGPQSGQDDSGSPGSCEKAKIAQDLQSVTNDSILAAPYPVQEACRQADRISDDEIHESATECSGRQAPDSGARPIAPHGSLILQAVTGRGVPRPVIQDVIAAPGSLPQMHADTANQTSVQETAPGVGRPEAAFAIEARGSRPHPAAGINPQSAMPSDTIGRTPLRAGGFAADATWPQSSTDLRPLARISASSALAPSEEFLYLPAASIQPAAAAAEQILDSSRISPGNSDPEPVEIIATPRDPLAAFAATPHSPLGQMDSVPAPLSAPFRQMAAVADLSRAQRQGVAIPVEQVDGPHDPAVVLQRESEPLTGADDLSAVPGLSQQTGIQKQFRAARSEPGRIQADGRIATQGAGGREPAQMRGGLLVYLPEFSVAMATPHTTTGRPGMGANSDEEPRPERAGSTASESMPVQRTDAETARQKSAGFAPQIEAVNLEEASASPMLHAASLRSAASTPDTVGSLREVQNGSRGSSIEWGIEVAAGQTPAGADMKALTALIPPKSAAGAHDLSFMYQLAERIQMQLRDGQEILRVQLKPETLGRLEIKAESSAAGVIATITTESAGVKAHLEGNLHQLQQAFQDQGLKVDRINVEVQPEDWNQHGSAGYQDSRSGSQPQADVPVPDWRSEQVGRQPQDLDPDSQSLPTLAPHSTFHTVA